MLLSIIFTIMTVTATYTLISTTEVEQSGVAPASSTYSYERTAKTGQKGQMTAKNRTCLKLTGWDGCVVKRIELQMHSNTSTGAGSLVVSMGKDTVWSIKDKSFKDEEWGGTYTTEWVPISRSINAYVEDDETIEIAITATENSLYINSYTIEYEPAQPRCYTVTFYTGLDTCPITITQSMPNEPIELPAWQDTAHWYFVGWTEEEVVDNKLITPVLGVGSTYLPYRDTKLWSVYSNVKEYTPQLEYTSGIYAIATYNKATEDRGGGGALSGMVEDNEIPVTVVKMHDNDNKILCMDSEIKEDMLYELVFYDDSTVSILYLPKMSPIGYKKGQLAEVDVAWKYKVTDDGSLIIYQTYNSKDYVLYIGLKDDKPCGMLKHMNLDSWSERALWLYAMKEIEYTSWPFGKYEGLITIPSPYDGHTILQWGIYEIHIKDGRKILYIK